MSIFLCASFYAIYHCLLFIFMLISMNTNYWASNGLQNRGLWNQCSYEKNLTVIEGNRTSFYGGTCCSPVKYEVYIGATRGFFTIDLILHSIVLVGFFLANKKFIHSDAKKVANKEFIHSDAKKANKNDLKKSVNTSGFVALFSFFLVIPLGAYADNIDDDLSLGWSFYMLLVCFLVKFIINCIMLFFLNIEHVENTLKNE